MRRPWPLRDNRSEFAAIELEIAQASWDADGLLVVREAELLARLFAKADESGAVIDRGLVVAVDDAVAQGAATWLVDAPASLPCLGWDWVFPGLEFSFVAFGAPVLPRNACGLFETREELAEHEAHYRRRFAEEGIATWEDPDGVYAVRLFEDVGARWLRERVGARAR